MQDSAIFSGSQLGIHLFSLFDGIVFGKRHHTMQLRIVFFEAVQVKLGKGQAGYLPGSYQGGQLGDRHKSQIGFGFGQGQVIRDFPLDGRRGTGKLKAVGKGIKLQGGWK